MDFVYLSSLWKKKLVFSVKIQFKAKASGKNTDPKFWLFLLSVISFLIASFTLFF